MFVSIVDAASRGVCVNNGRVLGGALGARLLRRLTNAPGQGCRRLEPCSCSEWVAGDVVYDSQARVRCCMLPQVQLAECRLCQPDSSLCQLQVTHNQLPMLGCWRPTQVVIGSRLP